MKNFKSLAALTAASMISLASVATPIFAADNATAQFGTTVTSNSGLHPSNNSTITYVIESATANEWADNKPASTIFTGPEEVGMVATPVSASNDAESSDKVVDYGMSTISCTDATKFPGAGIFKYTIKTNPNNAIEDNHSVNLNSETAYDLYVHVVWENGEKKVQDYVFMPTGLELGNTGKVSNPVFVHEYNPNPVEVSKKVTGNQADTNQKFVFRVTVNKKAGQTLSISPAADKVTTSTDDTQVVYEFQLAHDEKVFINGLTGDDSYTVQEEEAGYVPSFVYTIGDEDGSVNPRNILEVSAATDGKDEKVVFTNEKNGTVPTGILMTAAPYVAVVGLGGVFAGMFFRRKRED